jgi:GT2 family glycosyltransferase
MNFDFKVGLAEPNGLSFERPQVRGKFLFVGSEKLWIRGVTYGTFRPDWKGVQFPPRDVVERDFSAISRARLNAVRVYTPPPLWLLDLAAFHKLRIMVGLPWEQHIAFLDDRIAGRRIVQNIRDTVRECARHSAVLCYAVGNEIPASVVRWYGRRRIEDFIHKLSETVKKEDEEALATYVNFPTTEYLELPFLDFVSFNVYLESSKRLGSYLARLQNLTGDRPLLMTEIGLDSRRNGEKRQVESLQSQISTAFEAGCAGAFVFAWTDEWYRGGYDIDDWNFGLTKRDRTPKPSLAAVERAFQEVPFARDTSWPKISVIVCSRNGSATIDQTLTELSKLDYADYEVIVVDDGSDDNTSIIAQAHDVRLIRTENRGLSNARNTGLQAATGEIVAYIDDDAYPDPHWLRYLAASFLRTDHVGIGGPNIAPPGDGTVADCVGNAPGGPMHVLLTDEIAEHIPGCNMAYWRKHLITIGGFDPRFRVAGDDVDIGWRLQEQGWTLGFSPAAVVWHHRRASVRQYLDQQRGYAKAEALLAEKWPAKYNRAGHVNWQGRLYGHGVVKILFSQPKIYQGTWGGALFQSLYEPVPGVLSSLPLMPEWYLLLLIFAALSFLGIDWKPLLAFLPIFAGALGFTVLQAARGGARARFQPEPHSRFQQIRLRGIVTWLHLMQPAARLIGRIAHGLRPWQLSGLRHGAARVLVRTIWCEKWHSTEHRLAELEAILRRLGAVVERGGHFDSWDLNIRGGVVGSVRALAMVEEHGGGRQLFRVRAWPTVSMLGFLIPVSFTVLAIFTALDGAWVAASVVSVGALALALSACADCATAMKMWSQAVGEYASSERY